MKTHKRVAISECCDYAVTYVNHHGYMCKDCGEPCEGKPHDLKVFDKIGQGHYRPVDNSNIGF